MNILAFIDCGGSATAYITEGFVRYHKLPQLQLANPRRLELADSSSAKPLTYIAVLDLVFGTYVEQLTYYIVESLGPY